MSRREEAPSLAAAAAASQMPSNSSPSQNAISGVEQISRLEKIPASAITVGEEIGKGRFKRVHRGRFKRREVVLLRYTKEESEGNELRVLGRIADNIQPGVSPYVPDLLGHVTEQNLVSVVQELAIWGALKAVLKNEELAPRMTPAHKLHCTLLIAEGMAFLESLRIVHADLSCRNVLMFALEDNAADTIVKITDFGLAVLLKDGEDCEHRKQPQATRWCSPETISSQRLSSRADVWSYAATVGELFHGGGAPWIRRDKRSEVAARLKDIAETGGRAEGGTDVSADFPQAHGCPDKVHSLMLQCLDVQEYSRPTFAQLATRLSSGDPPKAASQPTILASDSIENGEQAGGQLSGRRLTPTSGGVSPWAGNSPQGASSAQSAEPLPSSPQQALASASAGSPGKSWRFGSEGANGMASDGTADDSYGRHFKSLRAFLRSKLAAEAIPQEAIFSMWQEVDEAEAREVYLMDLVRRMQAVANESNEVVEMLEETIPKSSASVFLTPSRRALAPGPSSMAALSGMTSHEHLVPLTPAGSSLVDSAACPVPPPNGMWTLWSYIGTALRRQDFALEVDAWAAFNANQAQPCMLRDPAGAEAAARAWVSSYFKLVPRSCSNMRAVSPLPGQRQPSRPRQSLSAAGSGIAPAFVLPWQS